MTTEILRNDSGAVLALACARGSGSMEQGIREHGSLTTYFSPLSSNGGYCARSAE